MYVHMYYENHNFELINFLFLHYFFLLKRKKRTFHPHFFWQKTKNCEKWPSISILFVIMGDDVTQGSTTTRERECQFHESMYHVGSTTQATLTYIGRQAALKDQQMARHCNK